MFNIKITNKLKKYIFIEKNHVKLKDDRLDPGQMFEITDELKNNEIMIQQLEKNLAKLTV